MIDLMVSAVMIRVWNRRVQGCMVRCKSEISKNSIFSDCRKVSSFLSVTSPGSEFQTDGPAMKNPCRPSVLR